MSENYPKNKSIFEIEYEALLKKTIASIALEEMIMEEEDE